MTIAGRPRPVLIVATVLVVLQVLTASAEFAHLVSRGTFGWVLLATAVLQAVLGFWTQSVVTPLSDPQDALGRSLRAVPAPKKRSSP